MSTNYFRLREHITHLELSQLEGGVAPFRLAVWVDHRLAGILYLSGSVTGAVVGMFALPENDVQCPMRTYYGGEDVGTVVIVNDHGLPDDAVVISQYGEIFTVAQVKSRAGAKRADGMPTELFGYEVEREETGG